MPRASYAHISLQVQDGIPAMRADLTEVMVREKKRGVAVVTGTEANAARHSQMIQQVVESFDRAYFRGSDMWVAIQRDRIVGEVDSEYHPVSPGKFGAFTAKGVLRVTYVDKWFGRITHLVSHYKTRGQSEDDPETNREIAALLGQLGEEYGRGTSKVIYSGDQNEDDLRRDTFKGQPYTTCWDELGIYPNTHGTRTIDVIASLDADTRVKCVAARAVPGLKLKGDHVLVEAEYDIRVPIPGDDDDQPPLASPPVIDGTPAKHSGEGNKSPRINRVVIHSAVMPCEPGRARQLGEMNSKGSGGGSWHYAVDPAATFQCSYDRFVCWHAPPNGNSIGIEMADWPKPWPTNRTAAALAAARRVWRWNGANHKAMLKRTARLTAELCVLYDLPVVFLSAADLKAGKRGITTHAQVSAAFRQSTHWDPGFWPRRTFMRLVRAEVAALKRK